MAGDPRLGARDRGGDGRHRVQLDLLPHADVEQHLRIGGEVGGEIGERAAGQRHRAQHIERRAQAIAGEQIVREDDVARLLAAEREAALAHLLHHVLVADRRADQLDAERLERELEADVAHHGRDDRVTAQPPFPLQLAAAHQQHRIAVDDVAAVIDENRAVAVAVEGDAHGAAARHHRLGQLLGMGRTAGEVDVAAVGPVADHDRLEAEAVEQLRRDGRGRAVGAVDDDRERAGLGRLGKHRPQVIEVGVDQVGARHRAGLAGVRVPRRVGDDRLDLALDRLGELLALAGEHLDAVVLVGIVRRGDHDAGVVGPGAREEGDRGRRHHAGAGHRRAFAARAVRELGLDPAARLARVAADEQLRRRGTVRQRPHQRGAEPAHRRRIERRLARDTADAVGAEHPVIDHW